MEQFSTWNNNRTVVKFLMAITFSNEFLIYLVTTGDITESEKDSALNHASRISMSDT